MSIIKSLIILNRSLLLNQNSIWSSGKGVWRMRNGVYEWTDEKKYGEDWGVLIREAFIGEDF